MIWTTKIAIVALSAAGLSGGGAIWATADRHPVVNVSDIQHPAVAASEHELVPMQNIEGMDYDGDGQIVAAHIDGLEAPASAPAAPQHQDSPVS